MKRMSVAKVACGALVTACVVVGIVSWAYWGKSPSVISANELTPHLERSQHRPAIDYGKLVADLRKLIASPDAERVPVMSGEALKPNELDENGRVIVYEAGRTGCSLLILEDAEGKRIDALLRAADASEGTRLCNGIEGIARRSSVQLAEQSCATTWAIVYPRGGNGLLYWFDCAVSSGGAVRQRTPFEERTFEDPVSRIPVECGWCIQGIANDVDERALIEVSCGSDAPGICLRSPLSRD